MDKTFLFEVSWEICNKVGGIHTVIISKLPQVKKSFNDNYCLIGPWLDENSGFIEEIGPDSTNILRKLRETGIAARIGRWDTPENPRVILIKFQNVLDQNKLLYQLWEDYGVESMGGAWDYIEPVLFSTVAAKAIEAISPFYGDRQQIAQFHEWMTGAGLLYLKKRAPRIATVFTTHATMLGRSIAGNGMDLYAVLETVNSDSEAVRLNVVPKHTMECASAREADCFTTVSDITAREAEHILNCVPDIVLPNGFMVEQTVDFTVETAARRENRKKILDFAGQHLKKKLDADNTLLITTSGRYEFRNKGIDILLDSLGKLQQEEDTLAKDIVALMFVVAGSPGYDADRPAQNRPGGILTHPLWSPSSDPTLQMCRRLGLQNNVQNKISIIFVPVYLDGNDGVLNMEYYQALAGCDLSVFPSYYEPWGYTPLESIAYAVPTITTDLAGFGKWMIDHKQESDAVCVLRRLETTYQEVVTGLTSHLREFAAWKPERVEAARALARVTAATTDWDKLFGNYVTAFTLALNVCKDTFEERQHAKEIPGQVFHGTDSPRPRFREFSVKAAVPKKIERLRELAGNLWWSWHREGQELFAYLDADIYEVSGYNPVRMIDMLPPDRLKEVASDDVFLKLYARAIEQFDAYMKSTERLVPVSNDISADRPIAYFSMEYGLHESLPIYSGGLGILSGDHIKSSSDINLPLVAVGLLYKDGYFKQGISRAGEQEVEFYRNDFARLPVCEVLKDNKPVLITIELPGRTLTAKVWRVKAGRIPVYMLDTNIQENTPGDRTITARLYQGDKRVRIEQEIILGIGGIRLLEELNINPSVYHLNEGHSAFLIIERLINLVKYNGLDIDTARELVKGSTVFTTHTPVPAGNEVFDLHLVENYLKGYIENSGLVWSDVVNMGHKKITDTGSFEMTVLALKNTYKRNGVSRLHGDVSRAMWADLWPGVASREIPIGHITNGVHPGTWLSPEIKQLLSEQGQLNFDADVLDPAAWDRVNNIPDSAVWDTHLRLKDRMVDAVKERTTTAWNREGEDPAMLAGFVNKFSPKPLTIGFARRFATYKRADLFLRDFDRIKRIITNDKYPVQFVFAGKAHPDDTEAFRLIRDIAVLAKREEFLGRIIFVEGYNIRLARRMISGCDIWLNNPRRPLEASGTSGQKAGINGVLNFSVLDGWWDEAWNGTNGWAIGNRTDFTNNDTQDRFDSESMYDRLENEIIPAYYNRNSAGVPEQWIAMMKDSIKTQIPAYNTHRMLADYVNDMYMPAAAKFAQLSANDCRVAKEIADWKRSISSRFSSVHIKSLTTKGIAGDTIIADDELQFLLTVSCGRLAESELKAEILLTFSNENDELGYHGPQEHMPEDIRVISMLAGDEKDGTIVFQTSFKAGRSGKFKYGVRIMPNHPNVDDCADLNLVYWG